MNHELLSVIDRFKGCRVGVIGDAVLDSFLEGHTGRLCREAPVPVVEVTQRVDVPGGAANAAVNLRALGADVTLFSVVGDDAEGRRLRTALARRGVAEDGIVVVRGRRTPAKQRVAAGGQLLLRFDQGDDGDVGARAEMALVRKLRRAHASLDALVVSDYLLGALGPRVRTALAALIRRQRRIVIVDAKDLTRYRTLGASAVKPNYAEAARLLGLGPQGEGGREAALTARAEALFALTGSRLVAVTLDADGALVLEQGAAPYRTYGRRVEPARAAGAGDAFVAGLTLALTARVPTTLAAELASAAATTAIGARATACVDLAALRDRFGRSDKWLPDPEALRGRMTRYHREGRRIVFTNGCFDLLHRGHVTYLSRAKALGDVLVVGVNGDASVRRLKGAGRPINALEDRMQVLAALSCVDHLAAFDDDTAATLIDCIRPDVYVKGGDYTRATLPEAAQVEGLGGRIHFLPYLDGQSTSVILRRIRSDTTPDGHGIPNHGLDEGASHPVR